MLSVVAFLIGCEPETYLFVDEKPLSFSSDGGSVTIDIVANKDWTASSDNSWCTVSPSSGEGDVGGTRLTVRCSGNDSYENRTATITVICAEMLKRLTVSQSQNNALIISQKEFSLDEKGGIITISVQTNVSYTCEIIEGSSWIEDVTTRGLSTQTKQFVIKENTTYDDREGKIRFSDSKTGLSENIIVKQTARGVIIIEKTQYELSYEAQLLEISLLENTDYEVKIATDSQGWITKVDTKGLQTSSFSLSIEENEQKDREGVVYVTTSSEVITLKIKQADGTITIPDSNFRKYCIDNFDKNGDGAISYKEARVVSRIDVNTDSIYSVQGIEHMMNVEYISCYGSLPSNSEVGSGKLTSLDVSKNVALTHLNCMRNQIYSLDVSNNTKLTYLDCTNNKLSELDVRNNTELEYLNIRRNTISNLDISNNTGLLSLYCLENDLTKLNVSNNASLKVLDCDHNHFTILDISKNAALTDLCCHSNQLTQLDISNNTALICLDCSFNHMLTSLDVTKNIALQRLSCSYTQLSSLDVSNNTELTYLWCPYNQLKTLDVSNNPSLEKLYCNNTTLTDLYLAEGQTFKESDWYSGTRVSYVIGQENGHEWVDLGLPSGLKWATCNVGANSPSDYGSSFAWGETTPKSGGNTWENYRFRLEGDSDDNVTFTKYNSFSDRGIVDYKTLLDMEDDAARVNWSGNWRMPTLSEMKELIDNCTWTRITYEGQEGYKVTGKNGKSVFFRFAHYNSSTNVNFSSSIWNGTLAMGSTYHNTQGDPRELAGPVRPVLGDQVRVSSISIRNQLSLVVGNSTQLSVEITPDNAAERGVKWSLSDPTVVSVEVIYNNTILVTALQSGTTTIIASTVDRGFVAQCTVIVKELVTTGQENGHDWVDLGLPSGIKWATCNVGASSPSDYGNYYAWGETKPKEEYAWDNYRFRLSGNSDENVTFSKYNSQNERGLVDNKTCLDLEDDAAHVNWGGNWRMPTANEFHELISNCTWTWLTQDGKDGYLVIGKNGKSIFFPRAGESHRFSWGAHGYYWSSSLQHDDYHPQEDPLHLMINSDFNPWLFYGSRDYGYSVRPVTE